MSVYLSVDLDYWGSATARCNEKMSCTRFINKLLRLGVPTLIVRHHHYMLDDVNDSGCSFIEHIDYHSDLTDWPGKIKKFTDKPYHGRMHLNCGTWLNYVKWRDVGEVRWRYPSNECAAGNDIGQGHCYTVLNPFEYPVSGWKKTSHKRGLRGIPWKRVSRAGIAISDEWWHDHGQTYERILPKLVGIGKYPGHDWQDMFDCKGFRRFRRAINSDV